MADPTASTPPAPGALLALTPPGGLSSAQVAERRSRGLTNAGGERTSRSVAEILRANIFTRFNLILGVLLKPAGGVNASDAAGTGGVEAVGSAMTDHHITEASDGMTVSRKRPRGEGDQGQ